MKSINVQQLSPEAFAKYGVYKNFLDPQGECFGAPCAMFFRDMAQLRLGGKDVLSLSCLHLKKRPFVIDALEYHNNTCEGMLPLDADVIVQLAPPVNSKEIPFDKIEAFYVPKGTALILNPGVWHESPYVVDKEQGHIFCMLPERTYMNDAYMTHIPSSNAISINL